MKTISAHFNTYDHGIDPSITIENSYRTSRYYDYDDHAAGDRNRNASVSQAEHQRDACEEELYRLRFGIERLLAGHEQRDFGGRQRQRNGFDLNPFRRMASRTTDWIDRKNKSWFQRCTPCCRRGRRERYNDQNYGLPPDGTSKSPSQAQLYSDSFASASPSPSRLKDRNGSPTKSQLGRMASPSFDDPTHQSLVLKILEAKALDCLCADYSKKKTEKQISQALAQLNQKADEQASDSASGGSDASISSAPGSSQPYSPSPFSSQTPNQSQTSGASPSSDKVKSSLKSKRGRKRSKSKSNVTISRDKTPSSSKSRRKKRTSSKHRRTSSKKPGRSKTSKRKASQSSRSNKKRSRSKQKRSKSRTSSRKSSPSKTRSKRSSSKSPSRSKTRKKRRSKGKKRSRKKRSKAKSNNQMNDQEAVELPTFVYPSICQKVYENQQRLLKLLISSTS